MTAKMTGRNLRAITWKSRLGRKTGKKMFGKITGKNDQDKQMRKWRKKMTCENNWEEITGKIAWEKWLEKLTRKNDLGKITSKNDRRKKMTEEKWLRRVTGMYAREEIIK